MRFPRISKAAALLVVVPSMAMAFGVSSSANASISQCDSGFWCIWQNGNYGGDFRETAGQYNHWTDFRPAAAPVETGTTVPHPSTTGRARTSVTTRTGVVAAIHRTATSWCR